LDVDEAAELTQCVSILISKRPKGEENVSEERNAELLQQVKSIIQEVQNLEYNREQLARVQAARKTIADGRADLVRTVELNRATKTVPGQVQMMGVWLRYKCDGSEKHFFYNNLTKETVWDLPPDATSINSDAPGVTWVAEARFQIINPYLVS
jgi:hypothetical protein